MLSTVRRKYANCNGEHTANYRGWKTLWVKLKQDVAFSDLLKNPKQASSKLRQPPPPEPAVKTNGAEIAKPSTATALSKNEKLFSIFTQLLDIIKKAI